MDLPNMETIDSTPSRSYSQIATDNNTTGATLETIAESAHSRQSSQITPEQLQRRSTQEIDSLPSLITQSPSPAGALQVESAEMVQSPTTYLSTPSTPTRQNSRQSVVGLPVATSSASFGSTLSLVRGLSATSRTSFEGKTASKESLSPEEAEEKANQAAEKCWEGDESFIKRHKVAEYLGSR